MLHRTNSLGLAYQEVITTILRLRHRRQRVDNSAAFRVQIKKMIAAAGTQVRSLGYTDETSKMALYAIVGFIDENVIGLQEQAFAEWAGNPLQVEMFGGFFAGEYFFRHVSDLLNRPDTPEVADALELHGVCLLLGYRGRFAFGDSGEIQTILRLIREKIIRIRGPVTLLRAPEITLVKAEPRKDPWVRTLVVVAILLVVLTAAGFVFARLALQSGLNNVQTSRSSFSIPAPNSAHPTPEAAA
jgi:type VI secretion system protein ImpK